MFIISINRLNASKRQKKFITANNNHVSIFTTCQVHGYFTYLLSTIIQDILSKDSGSLNLEENFKVNIFNSNI